jgi:hypothetical protein
MLDAGCWSVGNLCIRSSADSTRGQPLTCGLVHSVLYETGCLVFDDGQIRPARIVIPVSEAAAAFGKPNAPFAARLCGGAIEDDFLALHLVHVPVGYLYSAESLRTDWCLATEPEAHAGNKQMNHPR